MDSSATIPTQAKGMLCLTTLAWTVCFAVWTIFSIIGVQIQQDLGLSETQFGLLISMPILTGAIARLLLGIAAERFGPRLVSTLTMLLTAGATWMLTWASSYAGYLMAALGVGLAGAVFITGISFIARWYPKQRHGFAFGLFGVGQVGAAITNFGAPLLMAALGWVVTAQIYAIALATAAVLFWLLTTDDPETIARRQSGARGTSLADQIRPLRVLRVWRFALYYFFAFGAFVALASWLPRYYTGFYGLDLGQAGMLTAVFSFSAAVFRALGGWLSDRWGPRRVMYITFIVSLVCLLLLSYPRTTYIVHGMRGPIEFSFGMPLPGFVLISFVLGFVMSLGMAAVYKHLPAYFPDHVGSVGGMVGMIGGLGGFFLPIVFGIVNDLTGIWNTAFMALFGLVAVNLTWMHLAIRRMERRKYPDLGELRYLPEAMPDDASAAASRQR